MDYSLDLILELLEIGSLIVVLVCFPILLGLLHINKKVYGYTSYPTDDIKSHTTFEKNEKFYSYNTVLTPEEEVMLIAEMMRRLKKKRNI